MAGGARVATTPNSKIREKKSLRIGHKEREK